MADPQIYRQAFSDNVAELIGLPTAPVLMKMFSQETKQGDSVRIDGLKANDATVTTTQSLPSRRDVTTPDFAEWYSIQTPYTGSVKQGSYVSCKTIEAADNIPKKDDLLRAIDIKSPTMMSLASAIYKQEDLLAIQAALAPTVLRELNEAGDKAAVALVQDFFFAGFDVFLASPYAVNDRLAGNGQEGLLLVSV